MSHLQDLGKVASGLSLVVKESIRRAPRMLPSPNDVLKAVTDLAGLTQGKVVKELLPRPHVGERAAAAAGGGGVRDSYLLHTLDSLGPPRGKPVAVDRAEEVVRRVEEQVLPSVAASPMSKPLQEFASDNRAAAAAAPAVENAKVASQAIEQVLQGPQKGGV